MEGFSKVFKNLIYMIENGRLLRTMKWVHSVSVGVRDYRNYREEGEIDLTGSRSR